MRYILDWYHLNRLRLLTVSTPQPFEIDLNLSFNTSNRLKVFTMCTFEPDLSANYIKAKNLKMTSLTVIKDPDALSLFFNLITYNVMQRNILRNVISSFVP
jgi:hypothetical protein